MLVARVQEIGFVSCNETVVTAAAMQRIFRTAPWAILVAGSLVLLPGCADQARPTKLTDVCTLLQQRHFVDLSHAFEPGIPDWPGFPDERRETLSWYAPGSAKLGSGFFAEECHHVGQWGTHVDPPAHFGKGLRTVDQIEPSEMVLPLVVIDVHEKAAANPDYTLSLEDIQIWENKHGPIPTGSFVAMRTAWSKR